MDDQKNGLTDTGSCTPVQAVMFQFTALRLSGGTCTCLEYESSCRCCENRPLVDSYLGCPWHVCQHRCCVNRDAADSVRYTWAKKMWSKCSLKLIQRAGQFHRTQPFLLTNRNALGLALQCTIYGIWCEIQGVHSPSVVPLGETLLCSSDFFFGSFALDRL